MDFNDYQNKAKATAIYPAAHSGTKEARAYLALGLNGEAGEVAEKIKKEIRDGYPLYGFAAELGDCLWYLSQLASESGISLSYIAEKNLDKLADRANRGVLGGSGDNR